MDWPIEADALDGRRRALGELFQLVASAEAGPGRRGT
jgi:hypothetical protein